MYWENRACILQKAKSKKRKIRNFSKKRHHASTENHLFLIDRDIERRRETHKDPLHVPFRSNNAPPPRRRDVQGIGGPCFMATDNY